MTGYQWLDFRKRGFLTEQERPDDYEITTEEHEWNVSGEGTYSFEPW